MNINSEKRNIILVGAVMCAALLMFYEQVGAQAYPGTHPFGGRVSAVIQCSRSCDPCSDALVVVGPPRGGIFLYDTCTTKVYEYGQIPRVGVWLLGNYKSGGRCRIRTGGDCVPIPHDGTITIVGTSR